MVMHLSEGKQILPGIGNSAFDEGNPDLLLFKPGAIKLLELEIEPEPEGSTSQGETLLSLLASLSSHLT
jgi:hypothetical protein